MWKPPSTETFVETKKNPVPGCDDAPMARVSRGDRPRLVTLIMPYYDNPETLASHMARWLFWPDWARNWLEAIIVDDGSPNYPAATVIKGVKRAFPVDLYRIDEDVRWNWIAARNLAFSQARANAWCIATDMDHILPLETAEGLVFGKHDPETIYRFSRQDRTGETIHPHPNSWFMTREMFWRIGGYDEALSGYYGTDREFRQRAASTAPIQILPDRLVREEFVRDASTSAYLRKQPVDLKVQEIISAREDGWKPKTLSFPWHKVG